MRTGDDRSLSLTRARFPPPPAPIVKKSFVLNDSGEDSSISTTLPWHTMSWPGHIIAKRGSYQIDKLPEPQIKKRRAPAATIPKIYSNA